MATTNKLRIYILTASVAAITATGAWYGAGLNIRQEVKQKQQTSLQSTPQEKLEQLELMRTRLIRQRDEMQGKIDKLYSNKPPVEGAGRP